MISVSDSIRARVETKIAQCLKKAEQRYNQPFRYPEIQYTVRGTVAGTATYRQWIVNFNPVLLNENVDQFIDHTVPHEIAHLITDQVFPESYIRNGCSRRKPHGSQWQSVMCVLGVEPNTYHKYNVDNVRVRTVRTYTYTCNGCGKQLQMGPKRHAKEQRNPGFYTHSPCGRQAGKVTYVYVVPPVVKPASTVPSITSKISQCMAVYKANVGASRKDIIDMFIKLCGCTPAGAATYYATCKKAT